MLKKISRYLGYAIGLTMLGIGLLIAGAMYLITGIWGIIRK